jgi:hypothetical protein
VFVAASNTPDQIDLAQPTTLTTFIKAVKKKPTFWQVSREGDKGLSMHIVTYLAVGRIWEDLILRPGSF